MNILCNCTGNLFYLTPQGFQSNLKLIFGCNVFHIYEYNFANSEFRRNLSSVCVGSLKHYGVFWMMPSELALV